MKRRWAENQRGRGRQVISGLLVATAMLLIALVALDFHLRPTVEAVVAAQARMEAFRIINSAMLEELGRKNLAYGDVAELTRAADGTVVSIETNMASVNRLKAGVATAVAEQLASEGGRTFRAPVGTLLGNSFTAGRGPEVEIRLLTGSSVRCDLENQFTSAGINQTHHRVMLKTSVQVVAVLPGYRVRAEVDTSFVVAETVVVGRIPEGYTIVGQDDRSALSKMHDYNAG